MLEAKALRDFGLAVASGALEGTVRPGAADQFEEHLDNRLKMLGQEKFQKKQVGYVGFFPPPFFWVYRCGECRFWELGECSKVAGPISEVGFCTLWTPPEGAEKPFTWVRRARLLPDFAARGLNNLFSDPFTQKPRR